MTEPRATTGLDDHTAQQIIRYLRWIELGQAGIRRVLAEQQTGEPAPPPPYTLRINGERRGANAEEVKSFRQTWPGDFLLDLARMVLTVSTRDRSEEVELGKGDLHRGVVAVLYVGMSQPGTRFVARDLRQARGRTKAILDHNVLRRYVCMARRCIGDPGRAPRYLLTVPPGKVVSETPWAYMFNPDYDYAVIESNVQE